MRTGVIAKILNKLDTVINPATEEKQDNIITELQSIVNQGVSTDIEGGKITVGTTPVELTFTGTTESISISSDTSNTGKIYIGKATVSSTGANAIAFLEAGEQLSLNYNDTTNPLYVVSSVASQTIFKGATL